jgi:hypothetical protein
VEIDLSLQAYFIDRNITMALIEWANDNEGYVDFIGHISGIQQRRQLLADQAIQKRLLSENIELHREALSMQKHAHLEQQALATWQDILFEIGEAINLVESHFKIEPQQAYAAWIELEKTVIDINLHHRLFRDLQWKTLCNEVLRRVQYIRDNLDSFISPSRRRIFEENLLKIQKNIKEEQDREAAEREKTLASTRAKEEKEALWFYTVIGILFCLWLARQWISMILTVACTVTIGFLVFRVISSYMQRREHQQDEQLSNPQSLSLETSQRQISGRTCSNCNVSIEHARTYCPDCDTSSLSRQKKRKAQPKRKSPLPLIKRKFCNRCPGKLVQVKANQNSGFDLICELCGRETWSNPRKK